MQIKEEFIQIKNRTEIQKIVVTSQNIYPQNQKHLICFLGGNWELQDMESYIKNSWNWAIEQGITLHFFNYLELGLGKAKSLMPSKRVDYGMSIVLNLLEDGIKSDDIILFGDCMGGQTAAEVSKKFKDEQIYFRCIVSNAASSLNKAMISAYRIPEPLKMVIDPVFSSTLKICGSHWKTHQEIKQITPYTMYFNREGDKTIKKQVQLATKIEKIEQSGRKKDYQKKEVFEGFEESEEFLKHNTILVKDDQLIDPQRSDKDIHTLPITVLKSKNGYTFPELITLYIQASDAYLAKYGSLNNESNLERFQRSELYKDNLPCYTHYQIASVDSVKSQSRRLS